MTRCTRAFIGPSLLVLTSLVLFIAGCSSPSTPATGGATGGGTTGGTTSVGQTVVEKNFQFSPSDLTVAVGAQITFENQDSVPHHVFVGTTDLGAQQPGQSVSWTAAADGTYPVKCVIHPSMTGQIVVGAGGGTGGSSAPPTAAPSTTTTYGY